MPFFRYTARTKDGEVQVGSVEAISEDAAVAILQQHGLIITGLILDERPLLALALERPLFQKVSRKEVVDFSRQLAVLFESRVPILEALQAIVQQTENHLFSSILQEIIAEISGGAPLSTALSRHPKLFGSFYVNMVRAGETSGKLQDVLSYLADQLERDYDVRLKVRSAFIYPAFVFITFSVVAIVIMLLVLPKLNEIFSQSEAQLPFLTRFIFSAIDLVVMFWWAILLLMGGALAILLWFLRTPDGRAWFDLQMLRLPVFGQLIRPLLIARLTDNLGTLIGGGVPIVRALEITGDVVGNTVFKDLLANAVVAVERGEPIHVALRNSSALPPTVIQMIAIGEKTGRLESVLGHIARLHRREVDRVTDTLTSLIEPFLIVLLGVGIGLFVAAVLLPIYNLATTF